MIKNVCCTTERILFYFVILINLFSQQNFPNKNITKTANLEPSHSKQTDMKQVIVAFHSIKNAVNYRINFYVIY